MIQKVKILYHNNHELFQFLGLAFLLLFAWVLILAFFPSFVADMHYHIIKPQADISAGILRIAGYELDQDFMVNGCEARFVFALNGSICIGSGCSGLELFVLFFGFILLMKGKIIDKLWFVPLGLLGILLLNIVRIISLSVIYYHKPEYLEFNHKYTFVIVVYGAIFGLWILWVNKFANRKAES